MLRVDILLGFRRLKWQTRCNAWTLNLFKNTSVLSYIIFFSDLCEEKRLVAFFISEHASFDSDKSFDYIFISTSKRLVSRFWIYHENHMFNNLYDYQVQAPVTSLDILG